MVGVGEGVQVLLGGGESGVAHAVFDGLEVGVGLPPNREGMRYEE